MAIPVIKSPISIRFCTGTVLLFCSLCLEVLMTKCELSVNFMNKREETLKDSSSLRVSYEERGVSMLTIEELKEARNNVMTVMENRIMPMVGCDRKTANLVANEVLQLDMDAEYLLSGKDQEAEVFEKADVAAKEAEEKLSEWDKLNQKLTSSEKNITFWDTGDFKKDVEKINTYIADHPLEFLHEDEQMESGSVLCRSRLVKVQDTKTGVYMWAYIYYTKEGIECGHKILDVYNP